MSASVAIRMAVGTQAGPFGICVVGMEDLHPGQAYGGQPGDLLIRHLPFSAGPRVGQHRGPARAPDQPDRADGVQGVPAHVGPPAVGDPVGGEGLAGFGDGAAGHHRASDVRTTDHGRPGDGGQLIPADVHAELDQAVHHGASAQHPVVADPGELGGQLVVVRVEQVRQQVHAASLELAGQLKPRHQHQVAGQRPPGLRVTGHRVVVGQRHRVKAGPRGAPDDLRRGVRPVGGVAVHVQVGSTVLTHACPHRNRK
jgi:hypothetical protein